MALKDTTYQENGPKLTFTGGASTSLRYNNQPLVPSVVASAAGTDYFNDDITEIDASALKANVAVSIVGGTGNLEKIATGAGKDSIKIPAGSLVTEVNTGAGNDAVDIQSTDQVKVNLGAGVDTLTVSGKASVTAGAGNDVLTVKAGGELVLADYGATGAGTDKIVVENGNATGSLSGKDVVITSESAETTPAKVDELSLTNLSQDGSTGYLVYNLSSQVGAIEAGDYYLRINNPALMVKNNTTPVTYTQVPGSEKYTFTVTENGGSYNVKATQQVLDDRGNAAITLEGAAGKLITLVDSKGKTLLSQTYGITTNGTYIATAANTGELLTLNEADAVSIVDASKHAKALNAKIANVGDGASVITGNGADTIEVTALSSQTDADSANTATVTSGKGKDVIIVNAGVNLVLTDFDFKSDTLKLADGVSANYSVVASGDDAVLYFGSNLTADNSGEVTTYSDADAIVTVQGGLWDGAKANTANIVITQGKQTLNSTGLSDPTKLIVVKPTTSKNIDLSNVKTDVPLGTDANNQSVDYNYAEDTANGQIKTIDLSNASTAITLKSGIVDAVATKKNDTIIGAVNDLSTPVIGTVEITFGDVSNDTAPATFTLKYADQTDNDTPKEVTADATVHLAAEKKVEYLTYTKDDNKAEVNYIDNFASQYLAKASETTRAAGDTLTADVATFSIGDTNYTIKQIYTVTNQRTVADNGDITPESGTTVYKLFDGDTEVNGFEYGTSNAYGGTSVADVTTNTLVNQSTNDITYFKFTIEGTEYKVSNDNQVTWSSTETVENGGKFIMKTDAVNIKEIELTLNFDKEHSYGQSFEYATGSSYGLQHLIEIANPSLTVDTKDYTVEEGVHKAGEVDGEAGNDLFFGAQGGIFFGGAGNDTFRTGALAGQDTTNQTVKASGDAGNDTFLISGSNHLIIQDYHNNTKKENPEAFATYGADQIIFSNDTYNAAAKLPLASRVKIDSAQLDGSDLKITYSAKSFDGTLFNNSESGSVVLESVTSADTGTLNVTYEGTKYTLASGSSTLSTISGVKNFLGALAPNATSVTGDGRLDVSMIDASKAVTVTGGAGKDTLIGNGNSLLDGKGNADTFIVKGGDTINGFDAGSDRILFYSDYYNAGNDGSFKITAFDTVPGGYKVTNNGEDIYIAASTPTLTFGNDYKQLTWKNGKVSAEKTVSNQMTRTFDNTATVASANAKDTFFQIFNNDLDSAITLVKSGNKVTQLVVDGKSVNSVLGGSGGELIQVKGNLPTPTTVTTGKGNDTIDVAYSDNIIITDMTAAKFTNGAFKTGDVLDLSGLGFTQEKLNDLIANQTVTIDNNTYTIDFSGQDVLIDVGHKITLAGMKMSNAAVKLADSSIAHIAFENTS